MTDHHIIASSKAWNTALAKNLQSSTGQKFQYLSKPTDLTYSRLSELRPRYVFFPHWSHRIPVEVFENFECIIFHMTDVPFGRGGSPLQNLIARGIYETRLSALRCVAALDAGPVYLKRPLSLHGSAEEIYLRASEVIEQMIFEIVRTNPEPVEQAGEPIFFKRRSPDQGNLLNAQSLEQAFDLIRMLDAAGYPRAFVNVGKFCMKFSRVTQKSDGLIADVSITLQDQDTERTE